MRDHFEVEFILFVADQQKSRDFYAYLFDSEPVLDTKGMTEFQLAKNVKLGLMPEKGIKKIIDQTLPDPHLGNGVPRCELYLKVANALDYINRCSFLNAHVVSSFSNRDWGDKVAYFADLNGNIIAFAESIKE